MVAYTQENCERLADRIIDCMSVKDLERVLADILVDSYLEDEELFQSRWQAYMENRSQNNFPDTDY